jgi:hypothetical protein
MFASEIGDASVSEHDFYDAHDEFFRGENSKKERQERCCGGGS